MAKMTRPAQHRPTANGDRPDLLRPRTRVTIANPPERTTIKEKPKRGRAWPVAD